MLDIDMEPCKGILFVRLRGVLNKKTVSKMDREVNSFIKTLGINNVVFNLNSLQKIDKYGYKSLLDCITKDRNILCVNNGKLNTKLDKIKTVSDEISAMKMMNI